MNVGDVEYLAPGLGADATTASTGFFSTPPDLRNAAQQTDAYVTSLAKTVQRGGAWLSRVPTGSGDAFQAFVDSWEQFYGSTFANKFNSWVSWFTSDVQSKVANFQAQAADWGAKFKKWGAAVAGTPPPSAPGGPSNTFMWIGIAAVSVVGLFIIGKLIHTVALGGAALEEAESEAMKIAEEKKRKKQDRTAYSIT
ncbi:MAG TPA: hypothetical protein VGY48_16055 [Vicinamibacterales bacterium]|nr:hypothetical protein [Vicinamibacterales bacterium]